MIPDEAVEAALVKALRRLSKAPVLGAETPQAQWERIGRRALLDAGINATEEETERAWRTLWQRAFMGGNYTLDARAMLDAARSQS